MGGALFLNIVVVGWMQLIEAINMTVGRPITAKQKAFAFYRPSAEVIAKTIADLPILAIQCSFFTMVLYFMADLWLDAGRFFLQLLFVFTTTICMTAFYRSIGSFSKDVSQTLQYAFFGLNMVALFAGYMQTQFTMKSWVYRWLFFATPVSYALEALMVNQFDGMDMTCSPHHLIPGVPGADIANQGQSKTKSLRCELS